MNANRTLMYVGVTNNIERRANEHKIGGSIFTTKYAIKYLVYYEEYDDIKDAIAREKS
jgi:putative endonuclease